jgi:hypothetical protein
MLLNLTNHPSSTWPSIQLSTAMEKYGQITDIPFPQIPPEMPGTELDLLVEQYVQQIRKLDPTAVHIMGELTFTFRMVKVLQPLGYHCIASTTERIASVDEQGIKTSNFRFVQFREY